MQIRKKIISYIYMIVEATFVRRGILPVNMTESAKFWLPCVFILLAHHREGKD